MATLVSREPVKKEKNCHEMENVELKVAQITILKVIVTLSASSVSYTLTLMLIKRHVFSILAQNTST